MVDPLDFAETLWDQVEYGDRIADNTMVETDVLSHWRSYASLDLFGVDPIAYGLQDMPEETDDPDGDDGDETADD